MSQNIEPGKQKRNQVFGSFFLNESEFAISVAYIQEIVNAPETYTCLPLSADYLKGLFNLRGAIIPVVDLRKLLNLPASISSDTPKIAILEMKGWCVGLLFDRLGEIFKSQEDERCDFQVSGQASVVSGVFKRDEGKRLVQILNADGLFSLENIPRDGQQNRSNRERFARRRGHRKQCISFSVASSLCAINIDGIQEILKIDKITESALSGQNCIGLVDVRGVTVPIVDFGSLLKYREVDRSETAAHGDRRIIIMRLEQEFFGLLVDSVESIVSYFADELIEFPVVKQERAGMFIGCINATETTQILLLDHNQILSNKEVVEITRGHSSLFRSAASAQSGIANKNSTRKTYITFDVGARYALPIKDIREIIAYPPSLLAMPGLPKYIKGVLNLRGEMITIVDTRSMYELTARDSQYGEGKILIIKNEGQSFGIVVDTVDSIVAFADAEKYPVPTLLSNSNSLSADVLEAAKCVDSTGLERDVMLLNIESLSRRFVRALTPVAA